jgi:hypothetical protein
MPPSFLQLRRSIHPFVEDADDIHVRFINQIIDQIMSAANPAQTRKRKVGQRNSGDTILIGVGSALELGDDTLDACVQTPSFLQLRGSIHPFVEDADDIDAGFIPQIIDQYYGDAAFNPCAHG